MESIRIAVEAASRALAEHPETGRSTDAPATAERQAGLRFRVRGPDGDVATDMAQAVGGGATAPSPGWLLRAALASCDATLLALEATREGIELTDLEVTVESDSDDRGLLGLDESVPAGPLDLRIRIRLGASNADGEQLRELARRAESRSPVRDAMARAIPMTTEVLIS